MHETYHATMQLGEGLDDVSAAADSDMEQPQESFMSELPGFTKEEIDVLTAELHARLSAILSVHADKIVSCTRLGGAEMTLSQAINAIWPHTVKGAMILEGIGSVISEIESMIANAPVIEEMTEEEPEAKAEESENEAEAEDKPQEKEPKKLEPKIEAKPAQKAESEDEPGNVKNITRLSNAPASPSSPAKNSEKSDIVLAPESQTASIDSAASDSQEAAEVNQISFATAETSTWPDNFGEPESGSGELAAVPAGLEMLIETMPDTQTIVMEDEPAADMDHEVTAPDDSEASIIEQPMLSGLEDTILSNAASEIDEDGYQYDELDFDQDDPGDERMAALSLEEDEKVAVGYAAELGAEQEVSETWELEEITEPEGITVIPPETAAIGSELIFRPVVIERIEDTLMRLSEIIEADEPEETIRIDETFDKISEIIYKIEDNETAKSESEIIEEIGEALTESFDELDIDCEPESLDALSRLILKMYLSGELPKLNDEDNDQITPQNGTHEIIKKLLAGLSDAQSDIGCAGALGNFALQLFALDNLALAA